MDDEGILATELVRRIAAGERQAEAELVDRYSRGLSYLLRRLAGDPGLSEDLQQETFRIAIEKLRAGELREAEKLAAFLRGIAKNLLRSAHRRGRRGGGPVDLEAAPEPADPAPSQLEEVLLEEDKHRMRRLLGELRSPRDREVLYRFHLAEESREEVCRALGLGRQQFNLVLFRARRRFGQLLAEGGGGGGGGKGPAQEGTEGA